MQGLKSRLAAAVGALLILLVLGSLGYRAWLQVQRLEQLDRVEADLQAQIRYEQERNRRLQKEWERVSSPEFPEEWARVYGGMVRPGEVRLVVPESAPPTPTPTPALPTPVPFWEQWWETLTGWFR